MEQININYQTIEQIAKVLNVKTSWVRSAIFRRQIPFVKIGRHVRFNPQKIEAWLDDRASFERGGR